MKRLILPLILLCLCLLAGCSAPVIQTGSPTSTPTQTAEARPSHTPQAGWRQLPTATPGPTRTPWLYKPSATPTSTLFPTLTPYPTLNLASVQTFTPAPPAVCPAGTPGFDVYQYVLERRVPADEYCHDCDRKTVSGALENGATFADLEAAFRRVYGAGAEKTYFKSRDLTGDGVAELIHLQMFGFTAYGCRQGTTQVLLDYQDDSAFFVPPRIYDLQDYNQNGIAEILIFYNASTGGNAVLNILEWDGLEFSWIIKNSHTRLPEGARAQVHRLPPRIHALYWNDDTPLRFEIYGAELNGDGELEVRDLTDDGIPEMILTDHGPVHWESVYGYGPWRGQRLVYQWDGLHYLLVSRELDPPVYRFQAVQDADRYFLMGEYERARALYLEVINSDQLLAWTPEMRLYLRNQFYASIDPTDPVPTPPAIDPNEYTALAAYARFRIVLFHLAMGQENEAASIYQILLDQALPISAGRPFIDLAVTLWNTYQRTHDLPSACAAVVNTVQENKGTLHYVSSKDQDQGVQSHLYVPSDVCPFVDEPAPAPAP